jgi:capsule polysaccharide modification protein KpsS
VNSTTGIESLIEQKPVLCLGSALYRYPELVEIPEITNSSSLISSFENLADTKVNELWVKRFCGFLYDSIQIDGNLDAIPSLIEIKHCCSVFQSYCSGA